VDPARTGQDVSFTAIAAYLGLGKSTVYRQPELRALFGSDVPN
jgi:hypothetical protein